MWTIDLCDAEQFVGMIDPLGHRSTVVFDEDGRVVATVDGAGDRTTTVYDDDGYAVATVDPRGFRTTSAYDGKRPAKHSSGVRRFGPPVAVVVRVARVR